MKKEYCYKYISLNDITSELMSKISELLEFCFTTKNKTPKQKKEHDDKYCSKKDRIGFSYCKKNGQIVGVLIILKRKILYQGEEITLGGVGGACTDKKFRRRGISTNLLKIAVEKLKTEKCDIVYLCTDTKKLSKLYEPFKFKKLEKRYTYLGKSGKRYYEWGGMIAPINSQSLFQRILKDKKCFDIGTGNW